jgi:hypothetical protein
MYKRASQRSGGSGGHYKGWHDGAGWWIDGKRHTGSRPYHSDRRSAGDEGGSWLVLATLAAAGYGLYRLGRWLFSSKTISDVNNSSVQHSQADRAPEATSHTDGEHRWDMRSVCIRCGRSREASEHFGWACD